MRKITITVIICTCITFILSVDTVYSFAISSNQRSGGTSAGTSRGSTTDGMRERKEKGEKKTPINISKGNEKKRKRSARNNPSVNRKSIGYSYRKDGIKIKRKRPPRWEVEGDSLFFLQDNNGNGNDDDDESSSTESYYDELFQSVSKNYNSNHSESSLIKEFLKLAFKEREESFLPKTKSASHSKRQSSTASRQQQEQKESSPSQLPLSSNTMWGTMSIGPIFKSKLESIYDQNSQPTPIQQEAFNALTKKNKDKNVVIASPTGSGKTLAYLLPLLATSSKKDERKILIVTPTLDLSFQIQKVCKQLERNVHVMHSKSMSTSTETTLSSKQIMESNIEEMLLSKALIIASTPRVLLQMVSACRDSDNKRFNSVFSNLKTIVLDEADRILQTELLARHNHEAKTKTTSARNGYNKSRKMKRSGGRCQFINDCPTIQLLNLLERSMGISCNVQQQQYKHQPTPRSVQLICASATVGRTLRQQIMEITNASSIEKGSVLVSADDRTGKDAMRRKSSLLPNSIEHLYVVAGDSDNLKEEEEEQKVINTLLKSMKDLDSGPSIIFPGKVGVQKVVQQLQDRHGLKGVKTLRNSDTVDDNTEEDREESWQNTSIFVIGEKFGRGLDIPNVQYVFISSPPTSPAAYAHLAGRTGRAGKHGVAVTFVRNLKEAKRLLNLSSQLGIKFGIVESTQKAKTGESVEHDTNSGLSESKDAVIVSKVTVNHNKVEEDLGDLTVVALKDLLRKRNLKVSGNKRELLLRLKDDMINISE